jgi:hypothetical protein
VTREVRPSGRSPRHIRIFLASPGDVLEERRAVRDALQHLGRSPLIRDDFTIEVVSWDDPDGPVPMLATLTPQEAVRRALRRPSECDFTIVIVSGRMGTPLDERKPDGSAYRSGTEWEFEDARRAGKRVLLYRRATPAAVADEDPEDAARQLRAVEDFFSQFTTASGVLTGGVTLYRTVDELVARLRTDIETLLPALRPSDDDLSDAIPLGASWIDHACANVRAWRSGKLALTLVFGVLLTIVAWTAFGAFSAALVEQDAPASAVVLRYVLLALGLLIPIVMLIITWWWLGRRRASHA